MRNPLARFRRRSRDRLVVVHLNARLMPLDRGELFADPLAAHLAGLGLSATVSGGGTSLSELGEPMTCDLELDVAAEVPVAEAAARIGEFLDSVGAPRGSTVRADDSVLLQFGTTQGLALYLNGTDLPDEVYAASDTNELARAVGDALGDAGRMLSSWHGPTETALYLYGPSSATMRARLADLLATRADAQLSRLEDIA